MANHPEAASCHLSLATVLLSDREDKRVAQSPDQIVNLRFFHMVLNNPISGIIFYKISLSGDGEDEHARI